MIISYFPQLTLKISQFIDEDTLSFLEKEFESPATAEDISKTDVSQAKSAKLLTQSSRVLFIKNQFFLSNLWRSDKVGGKLPIYKDSRLGNKHL